jgi:hypothetical protein
VYSPSAIHFQMRRSRVFGWSYTPSTLSQNWTYTIRTAAVGAPVMSLAHYRLASASLTDRLRRQHPTAWNRFGAKLQMAPSGSHASIQKRAITPSPT